MGYWRKIINSYYYRKGMKNGLFLDLPYRLEMNSISWFNSHDKRLDSLERNLDLANNLGISSKIIDRGNLIWENHSFKDNDRVVCNFLKTDWSFTTWWHGNHRMKIAKHLWLSHAWSFINPNKTILDSQFEAHFFVSELMRIDDQILDHNKLRIIVSKIEVTSEELSKLCLTNITYNYELTYKEKIAFMLQHPDLLKYYIVIDINKNNLNPEVKTLSEFKRDAGIFGIIYKL